jgi:hypothetical protein
MLLMIVTAQTPVPATGKAPDGRATSTQSPKDTANSQQNPTFETPPTTLPKNSDAPALKPNTNQHKSDDTQQSVAVSKLPPVTIAINGIDWGVISNYLLVAVGIGGIVVAICTLCFIRRQAIEMNLQRIVMRRTLIAIRRQADLMEKQTEILKTSVEVAKDSAHAAQASVDTMISKERPRLRIAFEKPKLSIDKITNWFDVPYKLSIYGTTEAFISGSRVCAYTGDETGYSAPKFWVPTLTIPKVIQPKTEPIAGTIIVMSHEKGVFEVEGERIEDVRKGKKFIYCVGSIMYSNVFDETWVLKFSQKLILILAQDGSTLSSYWANFGNPGDNDEHKTTVIED